MADPISTADQLIDRYGAKREALVQILLGIQKELRWLPRPVLLHTAKRLGVTLAQIFNVVTFYKHFSLVPQGRHQVSVCLGTACHVRGASQLLDRVEKAVKLRPGETGADEKFSLHTVNCVGCCALGPVMVMDGEYLSNPTPNEIAALVERCD